jgi:Holliday junction resolvasome RuvABC endonuclease subunit
MNVLIVDPANSTGYCIYNYDESSNSAKIISWGFIDIDQHTYAGDQYIDLLTKIEDLIKNNSISHVGVEDYFFSSRSSQGANLNCAYRAMIHLKCRQLGLAYDIINISLWKNFINHRVRPTKEQKDKWGNEPAKKLMTQESLHKRWNIRFPNHSISSNTGKPIKFRYDIVDAVAMAIFHASIYSNAKTIEYSTPVNDIKWNKIPKGTYEYGGQDG